MKTEGEKKGITNLTFYFASFPSVLRPSLPEPSSTAFMVFLLRKSELILLSQEKVPKAGKKNVIFYNGKYSNLLFRAKLYTIITCLSQRRTYTSSFSNLPFADNWNPEKLIDLSMLAAEPVPRGRLPESCPGYLSIDFKVRITFFNKTSLILNLERIIIMLTSKFNSA